MHNSALFLISVAFGTTMIDQTPRFSRKQRRAILISMLLAACAYLVVVVVIGHQDVVQAMSKVGLDIWLTLLAASLASYLVRYGRWQWYIRMSGTLLQHRLHFLYYLSGFALTTTPGKLGETVRSALLKPHGVAYTVSLAGFFTERLLDVLVVALLASLTVNTFPDYRGYVLAMSAVIVALTLFVRSRLMIGILNKLLKRIDSIKFRRFLEHSITLLANARRFLAWRPFIIGGCVGLVAWSIQGLAFYLLLLSIGVECHVTAAMGIYAISLLAGAASFIPGGVGTTEVVMGLLISLLGADHAVAVAVPLISRLTTLWFAVLLGIVSSGVLSVINPKIVIPPKHTS